MVMRNPNAILRTEAVWVMCNAITAVDQISLRSLMDEDGEDVFKALSNNFSCLKGS